MTDQNRNGTIETDFGDGTHRFRLGIGQLEELQEKTGVGPFALMQRLLSGEWLVADVREPIRLGLIGGGLDPLKALNLTRRYVDDIPHWALNALLAKAIVGAAIMGAPEEAASKKDVSPPDETEAPNFQADAFPSESTTDLPLQSA